MLDMLTENGRIFMFGSNEWGQLGLGHTKTVTKPTRIKDKGIYINRNHTCQGPFIYLSLIKNFVSMTNNKICSEKKVKLIDNFVLNVIINCTGK